MSQKYCYKEQLENTQISCTCYQHPQQNVGSPCYSSLQSQTGAEFGERVAIQVADILFTGDVFGALLGLMTISSLGLFIKSKL